MNIGIGTIIRINEPVFSGYFKNARRIGNREFTAEVVKESYGQLRGQHTFTLKVVEFLGGVEPLEVGAVVRRKGRNLYGNAVQVLRQAPDEALEEKARRGASVRRRKRHCEDCGRAFLLPTWLFESEDVIEVGEDYIIRSSGEVEPINMLCGEC